MAADQRAISPQLTSEIYKRSLRCSAVQCPQKVSVVQRQQDKSSGPVNQAALQCPNPLFGSETLFRGPCVVGASTAGGGWGRGVGSRW